MTVLFANVQLSGVRPACADFPKPLLPWSELVTTLSIDRPLAPNGWKYSIAYWIEDGVHHVEIPSSSRAIRNTAFLGDDDELVIVAPISRLELAWSDEENGATAAFEARISWRKRMDRTMG